VVRIVEMMCIDVPLMFRCCSSIPQI